MIMKCDFCDREFEKKLGFKNHINACKNNPNRHEKNAWNKGLTKEQHSSIKKYGIKSSKTRTGRPGIKHSNATKQKLSEIRTKFLLENPDKVPYKLNHYSNGQSYAEKYWQDVLDNNNIKYESEFRIGLYSLDFKIGMIDLEIDGEQHYVDNRIIESDIKRTEFLESNGFTILRIRWAQFKRLNKDQQINFVKNILHQLNIYMDP